MKKAKPQLYDPVIITRVKQYLEENVDKTYLDVGVMTKHLQERFQDYSRRKYAPFRALVEQAYRVVSESYGMESQPSSADDSESDLELMDQATAPNNLMNHMMNSLYGGKLKNVPASGGETQNKSSAAAPINISSDESGEEGCENGKANIIKVEDAIKCFGSAVANKVPVKDSMSKRSTCTSTNDSPANAEIPPLIGLKRFGTTIAAEAVKKQKLNHTEAVSVAAQQRYHLQQQRHQQQMQRIANFNQNSNESGHFGGALQTRQKKYKKEVHSCKSQYTFHDIGGMDKTLKELCELLMHIKAPDIYYVLGLSPPRGLLLNGPSGCGKTLLANAIAGQLQVPLIVVPATELIAGVSGDSEERIRDVFEQANAISPCVLFIDQIDTISSNRSMAQRDMERRVVSQLISSFDNLKTMDRGHGVFVIGATTRSDMIDPGLRRVGRFDHEINIGIPNRRERKEILAIVCEQLSIEPKCDFDKIAELTPGYVGADLLALISRAGAIAVKRKCSEQIRVHNANAQKNMTCVDLADDTEESVAIGNSDVTETADGNKTANAVVNEKNGGAKECILPTIKIEKAQKSAESKLLSTDDKKIEKESVIQVEQETDKTKDADISTTEAMEVDNAEKQIDDIEKPKENVEKPVEQDKTVENEVDQKEDVIAVNAIEMDSAELAKLPEPTLFEMLNWMDNPPEDMSLLDGFYIGFEDIMSALKVVQPTAKREGFITVPDVTWDDVGSLQEIREELKLAVLAPVKFPEKMLRLGLTAPSGVLLCGPPGCGKTLLAKAIANEAGINFISVKGPELMNMYVGESERAVRACFQRARNSAPCVIFFDEFDSLCPKRTESNEAASGTRVVNQLLTEMDGVEDREGVYILAATNRPDIIDPAILRPGRLDTILYVGLPQQQDRAEILKATTKNRTRPVLANDVDFDNLAKQTEGYTGADLAGLVRQAAMLALKQSLTSEHTDLDELSVKQEHFTQAIKFLRPSVTAQDRKIYEKLRIKYAAPRIDVTNENIE